MSPKESEDREGEHRHVDVGHASAARDAVKKSTPSAANDNSIAWPLIPFPGGWYAS
jgi:hypothetical protein